MMAISSGFTKDDIFFPDAYFVVRKITTGHSDEEEFKLNENGHEYLNIKKKHETKAFVTVYANEEARINATTPIHVFGVDFEYSPDNNVNIFKEAYTALKNTETISTNIFKDC